MVSVQKNKEKLVAKGYSQQPSVDYEKGCCKLVVHICKRM